MKVHLVNLERSLWQGEADFVTAPGIEGDLGIKPGHTPLLTSLQAGPVEVHTKDGETEVFFVSGGILEVQPQQVTLLADIAAEVAELDADQSQAQLEQARQAVDKEGFQEAVRAELAEAAARLRTLERLQQVRKAKRGAR